MPRSQRPLAGAMLAFAVMLLAAGPVRADASADLTKLLRDYGDAEQKLKPRTAAERGDSRYLDGYDESATSAYLAARRGLNEETRAQLRRIDAAALEAQDGLTLASFRWDLGDGARGVKPRLAPNFPAP